MVEIIRKIRVEMARRNRNHRRKNSNKNKKKISLSHKQHQDLEDKFSRMSITPSKSSLLRGLLRRNPSVKPTHTPEDLAKIASDLERRRLEPLVPPPLYYLLQEVIVCIELAEMHKDDFYYQLQLEGCEASVHKCAAMYQNYLPRDWKYDRATVSKWGRIPDYFTADAYAVYVEQRYP